MELKYIHSHLLTKQTEDIYYLTSILTGSIDEKYKCPSHTSSPSHHRSLRSKLQLHKCPTALFPMHCDIMKIIIDSELKFHLITHF